MRCILFYWLKKLIVDIRRTGTSASEIEERILGDAQLKGTQIIILMAAVVIASIGLNMNSTAVIIGAMLISPIMGSISALAYGVATNRGSLVYSSLKKLLNQVIFSVLTATIYFSLTPITTVTSELLARTEPSMWDVGIALFGGLAGAIGNTREEKGNVIPGVAIATALVPPLCTAGYGLATQTWPYLFGALYLFLINTVFIALGSLAVFLILDIPRRETSQNRWMRLRKWLMMVVALFVFIPSVISAYHMVKQQMQEEAIKTFIEQFIESSNRAVLGYQVQDKQLLVTVFGAGITDEVKEYWQEHLRANANTEELKLQIVEPGKESTSDTNKEKLSREKRYEKMVKTYAPDYERSQRDREILMVLNQEVSTVFPEVRAIKGGSIASLLSGEGTQETTSAAFQSWHADVYVNRPMSIEAEQRLQAWLQVKLGLPVSLQIIEN